MSGTVLLERLRVFRVVGWVGHPKAQCQAHHGSQSGCTGLRSPPPSKAFQMSITGIVSATTRSWLEEGPIPRMRGFGCLSNLSIEDSGAEVRALSFPYQPEMWLWKIEGTKRCETLLNLGIENIRCRDRLHLFVRSMIGRGASQPTTGKIENKNVSG